ncbi:hypothetical protein B0T10DRAFT_493041 [Thelonectria olida]|uniref:DUF7492 domain-containing protein n=1 Tax=Thelonectria olida TaxID=1576542 RepID=A0A9P8VZB9_9HYPO|nr:hypothetical protein B0T10DRAFT_493041 [Thelonectria olida]
MEGSKIFFILTLATLSAAHSWVERLRRVGLNGTMVGEPGYIRGAVSRLNPVFNDLQMQNLLPSNGQESSFQSDRICKETQIIGNYSQELPQLKAHPGDFIALQYQENGHVTLPQNTPQKSSPGNIYIYGTSSPRDNAKIIDIHQVWTQSGTGGDGRGKLLGTWSFDDGRCYQINNGNISVERQKKFSKIAADPQGADLWCQTDIRLPFDVQDKYSLYWVWDWPSKPTEQLPHGQQEIYTSCMDIAILPGNQLGQISYVDGQDLNLAGIKDQLLSI